MNDYHLHSYLCKHGEGRIRDYVEAALAKGLREIGFAEHMPVPGLYDPDGRMTIEEFPVYLHDVAEAQRSYPDIKIRLGIEAEYMPSRLDFIRDFLAQHPFDFVIGSVHFLDDWDFTNPAHAHRFPDYGVDETFRAYYRLLAKAAASGLYDVIGHFDIPKKFGHVPAQDLSEEIERALQIIKKENLALDVNTSGLRKPVREIHPSPAILRRAFALGIPIVIGSDAHHPKEVAHHFAETCTVIREIGYQQACTFAQRKRLLVALD